MNDEDKKFADAAVAQIKEFPIKPGDTLHVRVGLDSVAMGGQAPWIPGEEELEYIRKELEAFVPRWVNVWVTHLGIEIDSVVSDATE